MPFERRIDPDAVQRLLLAGHNRKEVAEKIGVTTGAVHQIIVRNGLKEPNKLNRPYTPLEVKRVRRMVANGVPFAEIARRLGRTVGSVGKLMYKLRLRSLYSGADRSAFGLRTSEAELLRLADDVLEKVRKHYPLLADDERQSAVHLAVVEVADANPPTDDAYSLLVTAAYRRALDLLRLDLGRGVFRRKLVRLPDGCNPAANEDKSVESRDVAERVHFVRTRLIRSSHRRLVSEWMRQGTVGAAETVGLHVATFRKRLDQAFEEMRPHLAGCV